MSKILIGIFLLTSYTFASVSQECKDYATALAHVKMGVSYGNESKYNEVKKLRNIPKKCWNAGVGINGNSYAGLNRKYSIGENVDRDVINSIYNAVIQKLKFNK